jgi:nucleoside-diphosphate-sugar epimerase
VLFEGHFKRNYIHVRDVANAFNFAINNSDKMNNNIYNVGLTEANISKMELCAEICKLVPDFVIKEEEFTKDPDQRNYIVSNSKIENLGFRAQINLESGLNELVSGIQIFKNFLNGMKLEWGKLSHLQLTSTATYLHENCHHFLSTTIAFHTLRSKLQKN